MKWVLGTDWQWVLGTTSVGILCALNFLCGFLVGKGLGTLQEYNAENVEDIEVKDLFD